MLRISVDFNTMMMDDRERVYINLHTNKGLGDQLRSGSLVVLYDEELEVEAVVEFDDRDKHWWAKPDWTTSRDLPQPSVALSE